MRAVYFRTNAYPGVWQHGLCFEGDTDAIAKTGFSRAPCLTARSWILGIPSLALKLDRLRDAKDIVDDLTLREVKLSIGGSVHDPTDPVGRLLFNVLVMVVEFEADLIRAL